MNTTIRQRSHRQPWIRYGLFLVCLVSSMSVGQTPSTESSLSPNHLYADSGFVNPSGVGLLHPSEQFDTSANLMITGNVSGGKYFHGTIPYTSVSDFQESLQSSYLDSFRRYTQESDITASAPSAYSPFYSPTGTVTYTRPGRPAVVTPMELTSPPFGTISSPAETRSTPSTISIEQVQTEDPALSELEHMIVRDTEVSPTQTHLQPWQTTPPDHEAWVNQITSMNMFFPQEQETTPDTAKPTPRPEPDTVTPTDHMANWIVNTETPSDSNAQENKPIETSLITSDIQQDIEQAQALLDSLDSLHKMNLDVPTIPKKSVIPSEPNEPPSVMVTNTLPQDTTVQAFHEAKYDTFIKAGEAYLKQGQYQQAESAYTMASVYRTDDTEAWAGRSIALLAQAQYAGSALFLKRALHVVPDYAQVRIDLPALVGGRDAVVKHIKTLKVFQDNPHTPDLHLLLAYIYLQMNDWGLAQKILDNDIVSHPDDLTLAALQAALTKALE